MRTLVGELAADFDWKERHDEGFRVEGLGFRGLGLGVEGLGF